MSYNKSLFQGVPKIKPGSSYFDMSHEWKDDLVPGRLIPCFMKECMPQDNWKIRPEFFFRCDPLYYPIVQKLTMRWDLFWIPFRILWPEDDLGGSWTKWITGQTDITPPYHSADMSRELTVWGTDVHAIPNQVLSYMGLPLLKPVEDITSTVIVDLNAFPLSAYLKVWDEYYRNPQLEEERWFPLAGADMTASFDTAFDNGLFPGYFGCFSAKWEMDYFTSALPTPQVGEAILIPSVEDGFPKETTQWKKSSDGSLAPDGDLTVDTGGSGEDGGTMVAGTGVYHEHNATIKQLRLAEVLQSFYERMMKVGQRYRDYIEGMFGDDPQPGTVDVPVAVGSLFGRFQVADVMQQATTEVDSIKHRTGDYTGQINMYQNGEETLRYKCLEHGILLGILQVNPNTGYGQGVERFWRRRFLTDYPMDRFANIGDQEILKEEVVYNPVIAQEELNRDTFGYIPRFSEMRYACNHYGGRLSYGIGLSKHLGRHWFGEDGYTNPTEYGNRIEINSDFVSSVASNLGGTRITDVWRALPSEASQSPTQGVITAYVLFEASVERQLPLYSTPNLT